MILAFLLACTPKPAPPAAAAAPAPAPVQVDYSGLFGGMSNSGIVHRELVVPGLLERVWLEPSALSVVVPDTGVETWTRQILLETLQTRGTLVLTDPPAAATPDLAPESLPTAYIWGLRFASGIDEVPVVVKPDGDELKVTIRSWPDESTLCPEATLPLHYIELHGTLQRASDHAVVGAWHEVSLVGLPGEATIALPLELEDPLVACAVILEAARSHRDLQPPTEAFAQSAHHLLEVALAPLTRD